MPVTKDGIAAANDRPHREVNIPEWGGKVRILTMSAGERDSWEQSDLDYQTGDDGKIRVVPKKLDRRARLLVRCLADENSNRIFSDSDEDVMALSQKSGAILDPLFARALKLNRLRNSDLEEIKKNLESDPDSVPT